MKLLPMVMVDWVDSCGSNGWKTPSDLREMIAAPGQLQRSVGFLFLHDKRNLVIVQSVQVVEDGFMGAALQIPAAAVRRVRRLKT